MKHEDEPVNDYKKRMKEYITDLIKQEVIALGETKKKDSRGTVRDYKKEYAKYGSSKKAKKYRAELNQYNRKKGTYGNGDGKDASHKGGKIVGFESQSKNRGRAEKSRLKKEDIKEKSIPHTNPSYRMEKTMQKLAKSLGIKSVVSMYTGKGSLSYFLDDDREAKKLQKFLQKSFKRVRLIPLDKSKGDTANWVVAADMIGFESVNERTRMKPQVKKLLKQKGYGPIFGAIDSSKQQLKQMRYSRGEIRDTLISMFGDEDPKILQRIKESINEKKGDFLDSLFPKSKVDKAVKIAHEMGGDMTGAVKKIERYFKGMTLHSKVRDALQQANESINESEQDKIKQFLMKKGDNEKDATEKLKYYDMVSKMYKGANSTKKAEIMSSLWANEAVNNPSFFDSFSITEVRKMSDRELKDYLLYMKKYKPDVWNHMKKNKDLKKMIRKLRVESVNEGVSKSQAQEIMNQLGGRKFEMLMGVKSKGIGKDGLILHIGKNPKRVSHIIIDLDRGRDLYNLTFGKIVKYQFKVIKKLKGIYVDQLHDMIEKYTGNLTTFRPRR